MGERQAMIVQQFQTMQKVVSLAFGAPEKEKPPEVKTKSELKEKFARAFASG